MTPWRKLALEPSLLNRGCTTTPPPPIHCSVKSTFLAPVTTTIDPNLTMGELMVAYPSARRALFKAYHIGGCASCGFKNEETLGEVCSRNENLPVAEVIETILKGEVADRPYVVSPLEAEELVRAGKARLVDLRTRE